MTSRRLDAGLEPRQGAAPRTNPPKSGARSAQSERLLRELRINQVELVQQNEQLRASRAQVEAGLERYTELYDFAPVGYFTLALDGKIRALNLPGARLLGLERASAVGSGFGAYVLAGGRSTFDAWLKEVFSGRGSRACAVSLVGVAEFSSAVEIEGTLSRDGQEARVVVIDITARRAIEEQLRHAQKMEVIGQLAGGVAHDFNNILAAMMLNLALLRRQSQSCVESQLALLDLDVLAKRASGLTSQLLLFGRRTPLRTQRLELTGVLTRLLQMLERLLGEDISYARFGSTPLWVDADVATLEQAVMNVCLNARDAMPNGGTLTLETILVELDEDAAPGDPNCRPGTFACLRISDTGCGMKPEVLAHLFEPFFTTKEVGKGTGLGLASAYGTLHQHNGWLSVESVHGRGTTASMYLPLSASIEPDRVAVARAFTPGGRGHTILLVEDEPELLRVSARALTQLGYEVVTAVDGPQALQLWERHAEAIDLLLTDMRMPNGITGLQLSQKLLKQDQSLKVIIMSGYSSEIGHRERDEKVEHTFLAKPFDLATLESTVESCLGESQPVGSRIPSFTQL